MRIALCGSTRFKTYFEAWNHALAVSGHTVYSLSLFGREASDVGKEGNVVITDAEKITLDLVHLDKILNSDAVVIIDVEGYIGFSTKREIEWARMQNKRVYWIMPHWKEARPGSDTWAGCLIRTGIAVPKAV